MLLPLLTEMYPSHPNLILSSETLTQVLKTKNYVKKPCIGRCGCNVTIYSKEGKTLQHTPGKYRHQTSIWQELVPIKSYDGWYPIIGSWVIHNLFGGFGIREDRNAITNEDSPFTACWITE